MADKVVDVTGEIHGETERAVRFFDGDRTVWLPKSQIEISEEGDGTVTVSMPEWLAIEKELV